MPADWSELYTGGAVLESGGCVDKADKLKLSESDICDLFITPAIMQAGWDQLTQVRREVTLTPGPVIVRGNLSSRNKKKKFADYVLSVSLRRGPPCGVTA